MSTQTITEPTRTQLAILRTIPSTPGTTTTKEVWDAAHVAGIETGIAPNGDLTVCGYPLRSSLRFMRRTGWLIFNKHAEPPTWSRTPTGTETVRRNTTRMATTPRQEATR